MRVCVCVHCDRDIIDSADYGREDPAMVHGQIDESQGFVSRA